MISDIDFLPTGQGAARSFSRPAGSTPGISESEPICAREPVPAKPLALPVIPAAVRDDFVLRLYLRDLARDDAGVEPHGAPDAHRRHPPERLVANHLDLVVHMAFRYTGMGLPVGDLISEGNLGLLRAAHKYNPLRQVRFSHYARPWIGVQMRRAVSYQAWPVSFPADYHWRHGQVERAETRLKASLNREADDTEVAEEAGLKESVVRQHRGTPAHCFLPLDSAAPTSTAEEPLTLGEVLPDRSSPAPDEQASRSSDCTLVGKLLAILTPFEREVLRLRFGLDDGVSRTLEEIGTKLGYVRQGIHRIETAALKKMRDHARFLESAAGLKQAA
jgi:RNA polymerase primary sigma factor